LTQKNQKVKTQQCSNRTGPGAGPLLRQPPRLSKASLVVLEHIEWTNKIVIQFLRTQIT